MSSSSDAGVRLIILGYHDFSAGTLSPSQPGLALTGRVEAHLLYDLYSVDGGVKLLQKQKQSLSALTPLCLSLSLNGLSTHSPPSLHASRKPLSSPAVSATVPASPRGVRHHAVCLCGWKVAMEMIWLSLD